MVYMVAVVAVCLLTKNERDENMEKLNYHKYYLLACIILILCAVDAISTIILTDFGGKELNPLMGYILKISPSLFFTIKMCMTACFVGILVFHKKHL